MINKYWMIILDRMEVMWWWTKTDDSYSIRNPSTLRKDVPVHLDERVMKLNFLVVKGSPYDVMLGDPVMEIVEGVLDLVNRLASFVVNGDKIEIPMEPDHVQEDPRYKARTDTE